MNSEAAGTEWIRKADAQELVDIWRKYAGLRPRTGRTAMVGQCADELAEVIARNVQPSPDERISTLEEALRTIIARCSPNPKTGHHRRLSQIFGELLDIAEPALHPEIYAEARPVQQPATELGEGLIARAKNLIDEIDDVARAHDSYEYGLPRGNDEILAKVLAALALRDVSQGQWVIVADGEGSEACVIAGEDLHESVHQFMCVCGKPWTECQADMVWDIKQLDKDDEWARDEAGEKFSMTWPHETGSITIYKLAARQVPVSSEKEKK